MEDQSWQSMKESATADLASSHRSVRVAALKAICRLLAEPKTTDSDKLKTQRLIARMVLATCNYYQDGESRAEVITTLRAFVRHDPAYLDLFGQYIHAIAAKCLNSALTNALTLLAWTNLLLLMVPEVPEAIAAQKCLLEAQMYLLYSAGDGSADCVTSPSRCKRIHRSCLVQTRRAISEALLLHSAHDSSAAYIKLLIETALGAKPAATAAALFYVAAVVEALHELLPSHPHMYHALESDDALRAAVVDYFVKNAILVKTAPVAFAVSAFTHAFLARFVLPDVFASVILPNLEKAIVRSSEVGLCHLAPPLFATRDTVDVSAVFASSKLLAHILSGLKSPKELVCQLAYTTLRNILHNAVPALTPGDATAIVDEILQTFKTTTKTDSRVLLVRAIGQIQLCNASVSEHVLRATQPLVAKETNEALLTELVVVFADHFIYALTDDWLLKDHDKLLAQFGAGFASVKPAVKSVWCKVVGRRLLDASEHVGLALSPLYDHVLPTLNQSLADAVKAPLPTVANKAIAPAYVCMALSHLYGGTDALKLLVDESLYSDKTSILTSSKVVAKLQGAEQFWCLHALVALYPRVQDPAAFAAAYLYLASSPSVERDTRAAAVHAISTVFANDDAAASRAFADGIRDVAFCIAPEEFCAGASNLNPVLGRLADITNIQKKTRNLVVLFVAAHGRTLRVKDAWIGLVLRAGLDPNDIIIAHAQELFAQAYDVMRDAENDALCDAACDAIRTMCFVNPEVSEPLVVAALKADLDVAPLAQLDETAIKIWHAPDGELVVDVLKPTAKPRVVDKNSKDYETCKWEDSLKKELSAKGVPARKLTREEQALVAEQLARERSIRADVSALVARYQRAFRLIDTLSATNLPVTRGDCEWFAVAVFALLEVTKCTWSVALFGESAAKTFIGPSRQCPELHPLAQLTGAVTLRALGVAGVPQNFCELPLVDLIGKVLFRIKMMADDRLSTPGFIYIAPLVTQVLETGRRVVVASSKKQAVTSEFCDEDPEEEHLSLAVSILSAQEMLANPHIPREPILESFIALMHVSTKAKMAKECFMTLCQSISINSTARDVDVLLLHVVIADTFVKTAVLQGIDAEFDLRNDYHYADKIWISMHDNDTVVAETARTIWLDSDFVLPHAAVSSLLGYVDAADARLRLTVARAVAAAVDVSSDFDASGALSDAASDALDRVLELFVHYQQPLGAPRDKFGLVVASHASQRDPWEPRSTLATVLRLMAPYCCTRASIDKIFAFLVQAVGDKEPLVAQELLEAGVEVLRVCGAQHVEMLVPVFENALAEDAKTRAQDRVKEAVIILYGALAQHLDASDTRLARIFERLLATLDTPSEDVQHAVSQCLAPLVPALSGALPLHLDALFDKLWNGGVLAVRKGAAYGIAGLVQGAGLHALFTLDIIKKILAAADERRPEAREGVAFLVDCLSQALGAAFEPYVIELLPVILQSLGDHSSAVRDATDVAARQIMKATTSYGVNQLIPVAISNLNSTAWRTKKGSVELLGSMAYLDPAQLSASLSEIVPQIVGVLNDSHKEVRGASDQALKRFGEVIRNPETQAIVPVLVRAIGDPTQHTDAALDRLMHTQFRHYIDGPSLALIIHVIYRGMRDRSAQTKRKACQIVGNMAILVDARDLQPYLPALVAELETAMVDPVPETRSIGACALGALVEKLGEDHFPDMIPKLMRTLRDASRASDRLGSAQALAEVICGLGLGKLDEMLPEILSSAQAPAAHVRAAFMTMLLYLPVCFGPQFASYLSRVVPAVLLGLADADEDIRDTALRAARLIVKNYAAKAVDLLLPELERGLTDPLYRIRLLSVELTGDLLFQVTGISGRHELSEEQPEDGRSLVQVLGPDRRDGILAALFVCRLDVTSVVRAAAIDIWKALVANTPKTVKEIIPTLTQTLVRGLAAADDVHKTIAAAALGDVVRRVGANALAQLLPALEELGVASDNDSKVGTCTALAELIASASPDALAAYQATFSRVIKDALVDAAPGVREAAACAFHALVDRAGPSVAEDVLPGLLAQLQTSEASLALLALQHIMATQADSVFPALLPALMAPPLGAPRARALSLLASAAGPALYPRLAPVVNALLQTVIDTRHADAKDAEEAAAALDRTLLAVDNAGVHALMQQLMALVKHQDADKRAAITPRLAVFFVNTAVDYLKYVQDMVTELIFALGDPSAHVVAGAHTALTALVRAQEKPVLERLVRPALQALSIVGVRGAVLLGFDAPLGPGCVLPVFTHGLMYGTGEQRVLAAHALADIVARTPAALLRPHATPITGPLIRVMGERVSGDTKAAVLDALRALLVKIPQFLRPFLPQLQRTFVRSLADSTNPALRMAAADALGLLVQHQPRVDALVTELEAGVRAADDSDVRAAYLAAILQVVLNAGTNISDASKMTIMTLIEDDMRVLSTSAAVTYARLLGLLSQRLSADEAAGVLCNKVLARPHCADDARFGVLVLNAFLRDAPAHVFGSLLPDLVEFVVQRAADPSPTVSDNVTIAMGKLLLLHGAKRLPLQKSDAPAPFVLPTDAQDALVRQTCLNALLPASNSSDTRRLALVVIRTIARHNHAALVASRLDVLAPSVFACLRDPVIPIRLAAEKAYLALFNMVDDASLALFSDWFATVGDAPIAVPGSTSLQPRSIGDYTKRVASRLAVVERERLAAGGDAETLYSDRLEDEEEIWAVSTH